MTFNVTLRPIQYAGVNDERFVVRPVIENPTNNEASDKVELLVGGEVRDSRTETLDPNTDEEVKLVWNVTITDDTRLGATVQTSSDSDSGEATFRIYNDTIRVRFDESTKTAGKSHEEDFIEGPENI